MRSPLRSKAPKSRSPYGSLSGVKSIALLDSFANGGLIGRGQGADAAGLHQPARNAHGRAAKVVEFRDPFRCVVRHAVPLSLLNDPQWRGRERQGTAAA